MGFLLSYKNLRYQVFWARLDVTTSFWAFTRHFSRDWALTTAAAVMMITPLLGIFLTLQRRFIDGLTQGGVKT